MEMLVWVLLARCGDSRRVDIRSSTVAQPGRCHRTPAPARRPVLELGRRRDSPRFLDGLGRRGGPALSSRLCPGTGCGHCRVSSLRSRPCSLCTVAKPLVGRHLAGTSALSYPSGTVTAVAALAAAAFLVVPRFAKPVVAVAGGVLVVAVCRGGGGAALALPDGRSRRCLRRGGCRVRGRWPSVVVPPPAAGPPAQLTPWAVAVDAPDEDRCRTRQTP